MPANDVAGEHHIACSLTSTLLQRVCAVSGEAGVESVLAEASCPYSAAHLRDVTNWVSYDEAVALFAAAAEVTGDPGIARAAGEETVRQHAGTAVATVLRSLGSPEKILEQVTTAVTKFSLVTDMQTLEVEPGRAVVRARSRPGFKRDPYLCDWTQGLLSQPTVLFGLAPAAVHESECQARGGRHCLYEVRWDAAQATGALEPEQHITALEVQLAAMTDRVESVLATASDLIADADLDTTLARITERAATAVRTPRYLLAVRPTAESELHCHHRGLTDAEAERLVERLGQAAEPIPRGWLVAEVRSARRDYGRLVAIHDADVGFFDQERELLAVYARYAATVLDRATALDAAQRDHNQAQALLGLARALAQAGGSDEVALRIVTALPAVVDCDRAALFLWDEAAGEMRAAAGTDERLRAVRVRPADTPYLQRMLTDIDPAAFYIDENLDDPFIVEMLRTLGDRAGLVVPIALRGTLLGVLTLGVTERPERVQPRPELLDLLSGVAAQAATALENGRLLDHITHQALHDGLTDLPNRQLFGVRLEEAVAAADEDESVALLYVDIDEFKAVNDEYGHPAGDALLRQVADRLALTIRAGDTVARLGGDEFAMVLAAVSAPEEIDAVAGRVRDAFEEPFVIEGASLQVSASVGRAVWPVDATEVEMLLRSADTAMYGVKRDRRARRGLPRERRAAPVRR